MKLADWCVYTIADCRRLNAAVRAGTAFSATERKVWTTARRRHREERSENRNVAILIADASRTDRLGWCGILTEVDCSLSETRYSLDRVRPIVPARRPQELRLLSKGRPIREGFQRPYAICQTPDFIRTLVASGELGWMPSAAAALLADSIEVANRASDTSWVLTYRHNAVRLNVGQIATVTLTQEALFLYCQAPVPTSVGRVLSHKRSSIFSRRAVDATIRCLRVSLQDVPRLESEVIRRHHAAIVAAVASKRRSPWKTSFSEIAIRAIEAAVGRPLSRPGYLDGGDSKSFHDSWSDFSVEEGGRRLRRHYELERDSKLVREKKASYRRLHGHLRCEVCAFDFEECYGVSFCEVHHLKPLGSTDGPRRTALDDLAVVCANCHRMIHWRRHPAKLDELRGRLQHRLQSAVQRKEN
jgi:hypothetical protein